MISPAVPNVPWQDKPEGHTGAPVWPSGLSCQGTLGTAGLIILTLLIRVTSFLRYLSCFLF